MSSTNRRKTGKCLATNGNNTAKNLQNDKEEQKPEVWKAIFFSFNTKSGDIATMRQEVNECARIEEKEIRY